MDDTLKSELKEILENTVVKFYEDRMTEMEKQIEQLKQVNQNLLKQQVDLRDHVAISCFSVHFTSTPDYTQAANDAYKAADAFLRTRDGLMDNEWLLNSEGLQDKSKDISTTDN